MPLSVFQIPIHATATFTLLIAAESPKAALDRAKQLVVPDSSNLYESYVWFDPGETITCDHETNDPTFATPTPAPQDRIEENFTPEDLETVGERQARKDNENAANAYETEEERHETSSAPKKPA